MYADIPAMYPYTVHTRTLTYKQVILAMVLDMHHGHLVPVSYILVQCTLLYLYLVYISSSIANIISLEQVMREDMVNYLLVQSILFSRYFTSWKKTREDRIRVKVRQILFGFNGDQWFSPENPDQSKYLYLTLTLLQIFPTTTFALNNGEHGWILPLTHGGD